MNFQSKNNIRLAFTQAMSGMYQREVPLYIELLKLASKSNANEEKGCSISHDKKQLLTVEHHGAIRLGTAEELSTMRRLFAVMGMYPVEYYDLSTSSIPVHSTAFRAIHSEDLAKSPFRVFCSLLRLDLIDGKLRQEAEEILAQRHIFPPALLDLIHLAEQQGGLLASEVDAFVLQALEVFRWHEQATIEKDRYERLKSAHALIADVVSFKGPHINHLTPSVLNIDDCQTQFSSQNIDAKEIIEGPPKRKCPILLRQTSFLAIEEKIQFSDGECSSHTARFGELEQRGIALTIKGRKLYDELLAEARNMDASIPDSKRTAEAFQAFPDTYKALYEQGLAYFRYSANTDKSKLENKNISISELLEKEYVQIEPIIYEDFLPVSAAGIFTSNLGDEVKESNENANDLIDNSQLELFQESLGASVLSSFDLYDAEQQASLSKALSDLS